MKHMNNGMKPDTMFCLGAGWQRPCAHKVGDQRKALQTRPQTAHFFHRFVSEKLAR
jgi:hypothetical protein